MLAVALAPQKEWPCPKGTPSSKVLTGTELLQHLVYGRSRTCPTTAGLLWPKSTEQTVTNARQWIGIQSDVIGCSKLHASRPRPTPTHKSVRWSLLNGTQTPQCARVQGLEVYAILKHVQNFGCHRSVRECPILYRAERTVARLSRRIHWDGRRRIYGDWGRNRPLQVDNAEVEDPRADSTSASARGHLHTLEGRFKTGGDMTEPEPKPEPEPRARAVQQYVS